MLNAEQRAHDLAIAYITGEISRNKSDIDIFKGYMEAYNLALTLFKKEFPEEK